MPKTKNLQYNDNWFGQHEAFWDAELRPWLEAVYARDGLLTLLEIGSYEGLSACWLLENALEIVQGCYAAQLTCIDAWPGPEYKPMRDRCLYNLQTVCSMYGIAPMYKTQVPFACQTGKQYRHRDGVFDVIEASSAIVLPEWQEKFHFIYIDGCHTADAVYVDTLQAFRLIRPGGMILWDDYCCPSTPGEEKAAVVEGVDRALVELGVEKREIGKLGNHLRWDS